MPVTIESAIIAANAKRGTKTGPNSPQSKASAPVPATNPARANSKQLDAAKLLRLSLKNEPDNSNAKYVRIISHDRGKTRNNTSRIYTSTITRIPGQKPRKWRQLIIAKPAGYTGKICDAPGIIADCECQRWLYMWEYACAQKGAAIIKRGNGEPPDITNPGHKVATCKHLLKSLAFIIKQKY